jgi:hypothetical protein
VKVKPSFIAAVVFAFCFFVSAGITCGDDDDDDDVVDGDNDDDDAVSGDVWTDSTSGLTWQVVPTGGDWLDLPSAESNCEGLILSGYNDWRLPTISEFRSLIRGCDATMTSGVCGVTDNCLSDAECWDDFCVGCEYLAGPGLDGAYWPAERTGTIDDFYWSSSPVTEYEGYQWCVNFSRGYIVNLAGYARARCVRP